MPKFHFTRSVPDELLYSDIQSLASFDAAQINDLCDLLLEFLLKSESSELFAGVQMLVEKHGLSQALVKNCIRGLLYFLKATMKLMLPPQSVAEDLMNLGLDKDRAVFIAKKQQECLKLNKGAIAQNADDGGVNVNQLVDMDWKFGVTASTSELSQVGSAFLQLKLTLDKGEAKENVYMELTLPQFYKFLHEIERVKANMDYLSGS